MNPAWRVAMLEVVDPFGWHKASAEDLDRIQKRLGDLESMTWNEILVQSKKQNHSVDVDQLCRNARKRLAEINQDDIDQLVSLRVTGKERIWGIKDDHHLRLLWWDPDHKVCLSKKR